MINAYLTIDDIPTNNTPKIIDFLESKKIKPIMFCWGQNLEQHKKNAVYALKHGAILQNHSYSHPHFSTLSLEQAKEEITKTEHLLSEVYKEAGIQRPFKLFRFPYGDQGGENRNDIQKYLKEEGFSHIDDRHISQKTYQNGGAPDDQHQMRDVYWTFDFQEYLIRPNTGITITSSDNRISSYFPQSGQFLSEGFAEHIVIIHDHEETAQMVPTYFEDLINKIMMHEVCFVPPKAYID